MTRWALPKHRVRSILHDLIDMCVVEIVDPGDRHRARLIMIREPIDEDGVDCCGPEAGNHG